MEYTTRDSVTDTVSKMASWCVAKITKKKLTLTHKGTTPMPSFQKLLNGISSYLEKRFESLTTEPVSCFKVFDHRFWPMTREDLLHYGDDDVKTLVQHFAVLLSD